MSPLFITQEHNTVSLRVLETPGFGKPALEMGSFSKRMYIGNWLAGPAGLGKWILESAHTCTHVHTYTYTYSCTRTVITVHQWGLGASWRRENSETEPATN